MSSLQLCQCSSLASYLNTTYKETNTLLIDTCLGFILTMTWSIGRKDTGDPVQVV